MKAMIENGVVTGLVAGDIDCGIAVPAGVAVCPGWIYQDDTFSAPVEEPVAQQITFSVERHWRTTALSQSDWLVTRHRDELDAGVQTSLSSKQFAKLLTHRQALRDWPGANDTAAAESRPQPPKWLARMS
ncbi:phage tail assembly chaperone [Pseudomonas protegens]